MDMRKRLTIMIYMVMCAMTLAAQGKAKYVFYFIGDGMGANQVNAAETYLGAMQGRIGIEELCFPSFPYSAFVNTHSATNGITDSAAGGTALACGQITRAGIDFLMKKQGEKNGFFMMIEGGKIDWACHANDMAFIPELIDMDNAVKVAYDFYKQHPDETLIVVTADHETGGLVLSRNLYELHLDVIGCQKITIDRLGKELHKMHDEQGDKMQWETVKSFIAENFGFWNKIKLSDEQTARLKNAFEKIMNGTGENLLTLYQMDDELAVTVRNIQAECALVGWQVTSHSNGYVPCFAIGAGADLIHGRIDNTEISRLIAKAAGWKVE